MIRYKNHLLLLGLLCLSILIVLFWGGFNQTLHQFSYILTSPAILITDFISLAGLPATLLNVLLTLLLNILIVFYFKSKLSGPLVACLATVAGFAFFGKHIYNSLPIYLGVILYAKTNKEDMRSLMLVLLLSSGISPIVSYLIFGLGLELYIGITLAIIVGIMIGYILPIINAHALKFHQGYNLYATGFSMGLISMFLFGLFKALRLDISLNQTVITIDYHWHLFALLLIVSLLCLILGLIKIKNFKHAYGNILASNGRLISDFFKIGGIPATLANIGIMGLLSLCLVLVNGFLLNGPLVGAIITVMGFSAFGKHPFNALPVMLGAFLAYYLLPIDATTGVIIALFFVTGLAPITTDFGLFAGLLSGFIHMTIIGLVLNFQGGFDLYNNGFAAGFVAAIIPPIFESFRRSDHDA